MIELRLLRQAVALARLRNFGRAAKALHITQPTLSRNIAALEDALGVSLFDRGQRAVMPTAFGDLLVQRAEALLAGEGDLRRELQLLAGLEIGNLSIGAGPYATEISVGPAVARLLHSHPRLRIQVLTADPDEIARKVSAGQLDVGIASRRGLGSVSKLSFEPMREHRMHLACRPGHPLAGQPDLALDQVLRYPMVSILLGAPAAEAAALHDDAGRVDPDTGHFAPAICVTSLSLARQIAARSDALFPSTATMVADDIAAGRLALLAFDTPALRSMHGLITRRDRLLSPAAQAFVDLLREVEAEVALAEPTLPLRPGRGPKRPAASGRTAQVI